jgi:hypothetical protein
MLSFGSTVNLAESIVLFLGIICSDILTFEKLFGFMDYCIVGLRWEYCFSNLGSVCPIHFLLQFHSS